VGAALTLPTEAAWRGDLDKAEIDHGFATSNIQPESPLVKVMGGPLQNCVVRVQSDFPGFTRHGTAFHVGGGIFLSAAHNFHERRAGQPRADCTAAQILAGGNWAPLSQWGVFREFKEDADFSYDVAICASPTLREYLPRVSIRDARRGPHNRIGRVMGFPKQGAFNGADLYEASGRYWIEQNNAFYMHKASTLEGTSGGPLLDSQAVAIGIHTVGDNPNRAVAFYRAFVALVQATVHSGAYS
jgi:V8-like Glu-specific endopeptidase